LNIEKTKINGCYDNRNMKSLKFLNCTQKAVFESKLFSLCAFELLTMELTKISDYYSKKNEIG